MSDECERPREEQSGDTVATEESSKPTRRRGVFLVALVAIVALAGVVFMLWRQKTNNGAGRPVPTPRHVTLDQPIVGETKATGAAATEPTVSISPEQLPRAGIKVEPVGEQLATESSGGVATGVVQPNAYRETPVISLVGGIVRGVGAELGQNVRRGQTLAVVFSDELADAQSRYLTALAALDEHHKHHQRTARLIEIGAASREEFEQATSKLKAAESDVASWRQRLLLLGLTPQRINALRVASQVNSEVTLSSPLNGTVTSRTINPGEVVEANRELLRVSDLSSVWVVGQVYEKDLARVRVGSGASVTSEAYPGRVFRGHVSYVDPRLDLQTRTAQVRIELANPGQTLKIGMYVNVAFATIGGSESIVPVVPPSAVQNLGAQQVVFVATREPNVFALRPVRLGAETHNQLPVLEGLSVGEHVVTEGSFLLRAEWLKTHPAQ